MFYREWSKMVRLIEEGQLKPKIHAVFALDKIQDALQEIVDRKNIGKIIIKVE